MTAEVRPDVSVIVIVHNDAARLPRAVESVRRQTLRELEIVISDDHSTDHTPKVARALAEADDRVRYHRLPANSGGCGAPRNAAIDLARAPFLMFLDSDDELPRHACESLLDALLEDDALDFAMGAVERVTPDGGTAVWRPHLVERARTIRGLRAEPGLLHNPLATDKMYRKAFLDRHGLRFPVGPRYADQLFSTRAYALAEAIAVLPEPVYRWHVAPPTTPAPAKPAAAAPSDPATAAPATPAPETPDAPRPGPLDAVSDRVAVHRLMGEALDEAGLGALRAEKDHVLLTSDLAPYLAELPYRGEAFAKAFAAATAGCLAAADPAALARTPRDLRVTYALLRSGRYAEAVVAARGLGRPVAPRETVRGEGGTEYWGAEVPDDADLARELEVSELALHKRPLASALLRHEITALTPSPASRITLVIRTYDPGRRLPVGPAVAAVVIDPADRPYRTEFRLDPVRPGVFEGTVTLDLAAAPLPPHGFTGARSAYVTVGRGNVTTPGGPLLAPLVLPRMSKAIGYHRGLAPHVVTVGPEGRGAGRLRIGWTRTGLLAVAQRRLPAGTRSAAAGAVRRAARLAGGHRE